MKNTNNNIISTINLTKIYQNGNYKLMAVDDVNISITEGEFVCISGESGSGKSTLLNLIGGLDTPTNGKVRVDKMNVHSLKEPHLSSFRRKHVGFVFQAYNLIPVLTVKENISLPLLLDKQNIDNDYIDDILMTIGLNNHQDHLPNELSGGQQQRTAIARALACKPSIILADEPTGNLDSKNSEEIMNLLYNSSQKYNQTIIIITHELKYAHIADRIITLKDGKIVSDEVNLNEKLS